MLKIQNEMDYEKFIIEKLITKNGFIERKDSNFDRLYALDKEILLKFLLSTQADEIIELKKIYKEKFEETLINKINNEIISTSLLNVLKKGVDLANRKINLMYLKPASSINKDLVDKYNKNILSVAKEVWASDKERVDIVIFLNGFAIMNFELKCENSGQNFEHAIKQYREERNPKTRLFSFKTGALVNFAMDLEEVYMTTKLTGLSTFFLPFNKGKGIGVETGKGNPLNKDGIGVSYIWEDILKKDTLIEIISKFIFVEKVEKELPDGKIKTIENIIFPRYHQLDCLRKTLEDVEINKTNRNYLIQHSAGSGKTYTIAWLSHRLASIHDKTDKHIFDNIIIVTDRIVVDRQLQAAVISLEHKSGLIRVMNKKCTSADLKTALEGNTKIIVTTIQKFLYIADIVKGLKNKKFAVIIDEAHSSTSGKDMAAVTKALGKNEDYEKDEYNLDTEDIVTSELMLHGKQKNVSMFAFTATPKASTLAIFGTENSKGHKQAFHIYSMKQAIEEGFILDVFQNFVTYETYYKINKSIEDDPKFKDKAAKRKIAKFAMLHPTNIAQRIEIIIEHFKNEVLSNQPWAKAMVVTSSRAEAYKYYEAFNKYISEKGYTNIHPLVAFTGKLTEKQLGNKNDSLEKEYTESSVNGFSEDYTATNFDSEKYQVLLVANKYQTGFDQPKLSAMYILKKLKGVAAVQTLSRLNRIFPPYDKKIFILDFINDFDDIEDAFEPYYTTTFLIKSVDADTVYELENRLDGKYIFSNDDVEEANKYFYDSSLKKDERAGKINYLLMKAKRNFDSVNDDNEKAKIYKIMRTFKRYYEFLIQATTLRDSKLHEKYNFVSWLLPFIKIGGPGPGPDLEGKIQASDFVQKKGKEIKKGKIKGSKPINIQTNIDIILGEDEEKKLSEIIAEINSMFGKTFDNDVAVKAACQIRDLLKKNPDLIASARANSMKNFEFSYYSALENALLDGLNQNEEFFSLLLKNEKIQKEVLGIFLKSIYTDLKK